MDWSFLLKLGGTSNHSHSCNTDKPLHCLLFITSGCAKHDKPNSDPLDESFIMRMCRDGKSCRTLSHQDSARPAPSPTGASTNCFSGRVTAEPPEPPELSGGQILPSACCYSSGEWSGRMPVIHSIPLAPHCICSGWVCCPCRDLG